VKLDKTCNQERKAYAIGERLHQRWQNGWPDFKEGLPGFDEVFGSVVAVAVPFQITFFCRNACQCCFFYFFKNYF
jgi:hypothetical protein